MKKVILISSLIGTLLLAGCQKNATETETKESNHISNSEVKEKSEKSESIVFSDEEYIAAAYLHIKSEKNEAIDDVFYRITKNEESQLYVEMNKDVYLFQQGQNGLVIQLKNTDKEIIIEDESGKKHLNKKDLLTEFKDYQKLLEKIIPQGKENQEIFKEEQLTKVDTKNLTGDQVLFWIRNYSIQNNETEEHFNNNTVFNASMVENEFIVSEYRPVPTGLSNKITRQYRVNRDGELDMREIHSGEDWTTISTQYIDHKNSPVTSAIPPNFTGNMKADGDNGMAGVLYTLDVLNLSNETILFNTKKLNLSFSSETSDTKQNVPVESEQYVFIGPNQEYSFSRILGPLSGDTPIYYKLTLLYDDHVIFEQDPLGGN